MADAQQTLNRFSEVAGDHQALHIAGAHGYRLDGDRITLWAEVAGGPAEVSLALADTAAGLSSDWLVRVETAQRNHPTEPAVQAAFGAVLVDRQLWGKARRPLELAAQDLRLAARARRCRVRCLTH